MLRLIWKYQLYVPKRGEGWRIAMPRHARFVALQVQRGEPVMWWSVPRVAALNPGLDWQLRRFVIVVTGEPGFAEGPYYVGTFQVDDFVGHVYALEPFVREG